MSSFWQGQPVELSRGAGTSYRSAPVTPLRSPEGLVWRDLDPRRDSDLAELAVLLSHHYGRGPDPLPQPQPTSQRISVDFLRWILTAPGGHRSWCFGLANATGELTGSIAALPLDLELDDERRSTVLVTLLCLDPSARARGLAPLLIRELTRRVNLRGIFTALFTSRRPLPVAPLGLARYVARPLGASVPSWRDHGIESLASRVLEPRDLSAVADLLAAQVASRRLRPRFDLASLGHWLLGNPLVRAFVVPDDDGAVLAFGSFYRLAAAGPEPAPVFGFYQGVGKVEPRRLWATCLELAESAGAGLLLVPDGQLSAVDRRDLGFLATDGLIGYHLFNWFQRPDAPRHSLQSSEIAVLPL